jgi:hypothetical protein
VIGGQSRLLRTLLCRWAANAGAEPVPVAACDLGPVRIAQICVLEKAASIAVRGESKWIVGREQDAVDAHNLDRPAQVSLAEDNAGRDEDVAPEILRERARQPCGHGEVVDSFGYLCTPRIRADTSARSTCDSE